MADGVVCDPRGQPCPNGQARIRLPTPFYVPFSVHFVVDKIPKHERDRVRRDLLDYCHRDALAMVRLVETLEGLVRVAP